MLQNGGWLTEEKDVVAQKSKCNIERHDAKELTQKEFLKRFVSIFQKNNEKILKNHPKTDFSQISPKKSQFLSVFLSIPYQIRLFRAGYHLQH